MKILRIVSSDLSRFGYIHSGWSSYTEHQSEYLQFWYERMMLTKSHTVFWHEPSFQFQSNKIKKIKINGTNNWHRQSGDEQNYREQIPSTFRECPAISRIENRSFLNVFISFSADDHNVPNFEQKIVSVLFDIFKIKTGISGILWTTWWICINVLAPWCPISISIGNGIWSLQWHKGMCCTLIGRSRAS